MKSPPPLSLPLLTSDRPGCFPLLNRSDLHMYAHNHTTMPPPTNKKHTPPTKQKTHTLAFTDTPTHHNLSPWLISYPPYTTHIHTIYSSRLALTIPLQGIRAWYVHTALPCCDDGRAHHNHHNICVIFVLMVFRPCIHKYTIYTLLIMVNAENEYCAE